MCLSSKREACSQLVVNENSRFPASSKYSQDSVVVRREKMHLVSLVSSFRINRVGERGRLRFHDYAIINGYRDFAGEGPMASSYIPLCHGILWFIHRKLRRGASGEQYEAADGEQGFVHNDASMMVRVDSELKRLELDCFMVSGIAILSHYKCHTMLLQMQLCLCLTQDTMQDRGAFEVVRFAGFTGNSVLWLFANREGKRNLKRNFQTNEDGVAWS